MLIVHSRSGLLRQGSPTRASGSVDPWNAEGRDARHIADLGGVPCRPRAGTTRRPGRRVQLRHPRLRANHAHHLLEAIARRRPSPRFVDSGSAAADADGPARRPDHARRTARRPVLFRRPNAPRRTRRRHRLWIPRGRRSQEVEAIDRGPLVRTPLPDHGASHAECLALASALRLEPRVRRVRLGGVVDERRDTRAIRERTATGTRGISRDSRRLETERGGGLGHSPMFWNCAARRRSPCGWC